MTPEQRARREGLIRELWGTYTPVRDIIARLDEDGEHWADSTCRKVAQALGVRRPKPLDPSFGGAHQPTEKEIRATSDAFAAALRAASRREPPQRPAPSGPWVSIMTRVPDPRLVAAWRTQHTQGGRHG